MKAMVLALRKGTRLFPLTSVIPKPMAPLAGKPIIQHIFELLAKAGTDEGHGTLEPYKEAQRDALSGRVAVGLSG
jgi:NDP-sugar pyrophosphorylase family protein